MAVTEGIGVGARLAMGRVVVMGDRKLRETDVIFILDLTGLAPLEITFCASWSRLALDVPGWPLFFLICYMSTDNFLISQNIVPSADLSLSGALNLKRITVHVPI